MVRIFLYVALSACTVIFGGFFLGTYGDVMSTEDRSPPDTEVISGEPARNPSERIGKMMMHGLLAGISFVGLAVLLGRDIARFLESRAERMVVGDDAAAAGDPDYEAAERAWSGGKYLEAIQLMRDYHNKHPREIHACLRIAEVYEKDLGNPLAAALEYEEVLKHKLPPERWGWAAIHLVNLYSGKLNKPDQGVELLKRIVGEYGGTAAARKARERLMAQGISVEPPPSATAPADSNLPPGFSPKK